MSKKNKLLEQGVREMTAMLRREKGFAGLRTQLAERGLDAKELLIVGYMEGEEGQEYGAVLDKEGTCFEFERKDSTGTKPFKKFVKVRKLSKLYDRYPEAEVALEMRSE